MCVCIIYIYPAESSPGELRQLLAFSAFKPQLQILSPSSEDATPQCKVLPSERGNPVSFPRYPLACRWNSLQGNRPKMAAGHVVASDDEHLPVPYIYILFIRGAGTPVQYHAMPSVLRTHRPAIPSFHHQWILAT